MSRGFVQKFKPEITNSLPEIFELIISAAYVFEKHDKKTIATKVNFNIIYSRLVSFRIKYRSLVLSFDITSWSKAPSGVPMS